MGSSTINATYNITSGTNGYWTWAGTDMAGSNVYDAEGPTDFTVNISVLPGTATIAFLPQGVGEGFMAQFAGFPGSPICMPALTFVRGANGQQFTFTDNNPTETDGNVYFLLLGVTVTNDTEIASFYTPDPIIINKDPDDGSWHATLPEHQLTAARS